MDNLTLVKERVKKSEEQQVHYLSLDNATKDVEIEELKAQIVNLEVIVNLIQEFEDSISKTEENNAKYKKLLSEITLTNYRDMMKEESTQIQQVSLPDVSIVSAYPRVMNALEYMYIIQKKAEESLSNRFHDELFRQATLSTRKQYIVGEFIIGLTLLVAFLYIAIH